MNRLINYIRSVFELACLTGVPGTVRYLWSKLSRSPSPVRLRLKPAGRQILLRALDSDLAVLLQTFACGDLLVPPGMPLPSVIVDAGANVGYTTLLLALRFPSAVVVAVEPDFGNFTMLRENTAGLDNVRCTHAALWPSHASVRLVDPGFRSWSLQVQECAEPSATRTIPTVTIPDIAHTHGRIDFLKMDIEGAETAIFQCADSWLPAVGAVLVEPHGHEARAVILETAHRVGRTVRQMGEKILILNPAHTTPV